MRAQLLQCWQQHCGTAAQGVRAWQRQRQQQQPEEDEEEEAVVQMVHQQRGALDQR
jgi:hypothetical protein